MTQMQFYGEGAELPEPTLDEAIRFCSDMAILEADQRQDDDPYTDDPRTLYRSKMVLE
jgi:hypothetical protein